MELKEVVFVLPAVGPSFFLRRRDLDARSIVDIPDA
jgi:hypothetical protein